jgi:hypothetical protein
MSFSVTMGLVGGRADVYGYGEAVTAGVARQSGIAA